MIYALTTTRTFGIRDINLDSLTLPAAKDVDFVELMLLYKPNVAML